MAGVTLDDLVGYCIGKPGAWQDEPDEWLARYPQDASPKKDRP